MKIYTRTGDDGSTGRVGGQRVRKDSPLIECTGSIDELNASIGLAAACADVYGDAPGNSRPIAGNESQSAISEQRAAAVLTSPGGAGPGTAALPIASRLAVIQHDLFLIGAHLSASPAPAPGLPLLTDSIVTRLEQEIDQADALLPPLRNFILPGGSELSARLHLARTTCRRAERKLVAFNQHNALPPVLIVYLNRLSDWLFVYARLANQIAGVADVVWKPGKE